jgi:hypothetical protein
MPQDNHSRHWDTGSTGSDAKCRARLSPLMRNFLLQLHFLFGDGNAQALFTLSHLSQVPTTQQAAAVHAGR